MMRSKVRPADRIFMKITIKYNRKLTRDGKLDLGQKINTIHNGFLNRGFHNYVWDAQNFNSGVYFIHLLTPSNKSITKVNLIK